MLVAVLHSDKLQRHTGSEAEPKETSGFHDTSWDFDPVIFLSILRVNDERDWTDPVSGNTQV